MAHETSATEQEMHELAAALGLDVRLDYSNHVSHWIVTLHTVDQHGRDARIHVQATLETVNDVIDYLLGL